MQQAPARSRFAYLAGTREPDPPQKPKETAPSQPVQAGGLRIVYSKPKRQKHKKRKAA